MGPWLNTCDTLSLTLYEPARYAGNLTVNRTHSTMSQGGG